MKSTVIGIQFDVNDINASYEVLGTSDNYSFQHKLGKGSDLVDFEGETAQKIISLEGNYGIFDVRIFAVSDIGIRSDFIEGTLVVNPPSFDGTFTFATLEVTNARQDASLASEIVEAPVDVGDSLVVSAEYPGKNINLAWSLSPPPGHSLEGSIVTSELLNDTFFDHFSIAIKTGQNGVPVSDAALSNAQSLKGYLRTNNVTEALNNYSGFSFNLTPQIFNDENLNFGREVSFEITAHDINGNTSTGILSGINFAPEPDSLIYSLNGMEAAFSWNINTSDFVALNISSLAIPSSKTLEHPEDLQKSREYLEDCEAAINWSNVPNIVYSSGDKVEYQDVLYKCILDHTAGPAQILPTDTSYWSEIGEFYEFKYNEYVSSEQSIEIPQVWGYSYYYTFQAVDDFGPGEIFNLTEDGIVDSTDTGEFRELYGLSPELNIANIRFRERKDDLVFNWDILDQDGNVVDLNQYKVAFSTSDVPSVLGISGHLYNEDTNIFLSGITEGNKSRSKSISDDGSEVVVYDLPTAKVFDTFEFTRKLNNEIFSNASYPEGWEYFDDTRVYNTGDFVIGGDGFLYNVVDSIPLLDKSAVPLDDQYHGYPGSFIVDDKYYYLCVEENSWRRIGAATITRSQSSFFGDTDFDDNFLYICKETTSWLKIPLADTNLNKQGQVGEIDFDLNYIYVRTNDGWKRHALSRWNGTSIGGGGADLAYVKPFYESWDPSKTYYKYLDTPWPEVFEYDDQLYSTNQTFGPTHVDGLFDYDAIYSAGSIVIAPTDSSIRQYVQQAYAVGNIVLYSNGIYRNLVYQSAENVVAPDSDRRKWKLLSPFSDVDCAYYEYVGPGTIVNSIPALGSWVIKNPDNLSSFDLYASGYQYPELQNWNDQDEFSEGSLVVYNNDIWSGLADSGPDTDVGAQVPDAIPSDFWANQNAAGEDFFSQNQPGDRIFHNGTVYQCLDVNPTGAPILASTNSPEQINSSYLNSQWMPLWELNDEYNDFVFGHIGIPESGKRSVGFEVGIISSDGDVLDVQRIVGRNPEPSILSAGFTVDSLSEAGKVKFDFNYAFGLREKTTKVHLYRSSEPNFSITGSDGLALSSIEEGGSLVKVVLGAGDATFGDNITEIFDTPPVPVENGDEQITGYYYKILPFDDFGSGDLLSIDNKVLVYPKNFNTQDPSAPAGPVIRTTADEIPGPVVDFEGRTAFENFFLSWQIPGSEDSNLLKNIPNDLSHYEVWSGENDHLYFGSLNTALTQEANKNGYRRILGDLQSLGNIPLEQLDPAEGITNAINIFNVATNGNSTQVSREGESNQEAYFWVRAVDKAGNKGPFTGKANLDGDNVEGLRLQLGQMDATDIDGFETSLTDTFPNTIALEPNNPFESDPTAGTVSWSSHSLFHNGEQYIIEGGQFNNDGYIWWNDEATKYETSATHPAGNGGDPIDGFDDGDFIIARVRNGVATPVFHVFANALIGTANIADAAIVNAKINDLSADKITAGVIGAEDIEIGELGNIRSVGFTGLSDPSKGFVVSGDGSFVFAAKNGRLHFDNDQLVLEGKLRQVDGTEYSFIDITAEPSFFFYSEDQNGDLLPDGQQAIDIYARYQNSDITANDVRFKMTTAEGRSIFTYDEFENRVDNSISGFTYDPTDGSQDFSDQDIKIAHAEFECQISSPDLINPGFDNIYDTYDEFAVILYASGVGTSVETSTTISLISNGNPGENARSVKLTADTLVVTYDAEGKNGSPNSINISASTINTEEDVYYEFFLNDSLEQNTISSSYEYTPPNNLTDLPDQVEVKIKEGSLNGVVVATDKITIGGVRPGLKGVDAINFFYSNSSHTVPVDYQGDETWESSGGELQVYDGINALELDTTQLVDGFISQSSDFPSTNGKYRIDIFRKSGNTITEPAISSNAEATTATLGDWSGNLTTLTVYTVKLSIKSNDGNQYTLSFNISLAPAHQGIQGNNGEEGRSPTFRGKYSPDENYYAVDPVAANNQPGRGDIVYHGDTYYIAIQDSKGQNPSSNSDYWKEFGAEFSSVATELLLTKEAFVQQKLTLGEGGNQLTEAKDGIIVSAGFVGGLYNTAEGEPYAVPLTDENYSDAEFLENYSNAGFLLARTAGDSPRVYFDIGGRGVGNQPSYLRFDGGGNSKIEIAGSFINNTVLDENIVYDKNWAAINGLEDFDRFTSFIGGGFNNLLEPGELGDEYSQNIGSSIVGGARNKMKSRFSFIGGGYGGTCRDNFSAIVGGFNNSMPLEEPGDHQGANFIGCGIQNMINGGASQGIVNGSNNTIEGEIGDFIPVRDNDQSILSQGLLGIAGGGSFSETSRGWIQDIWFPGFHTIDPNNNQTNWGQELYVGDLRGLVNGQWAFHSHLEWLYIAPQASFIYKHNDLGIYGLADFLVNNYLEEEGIYVYHTFLNYAGWYFYYRDPLGRYVDTNTIKIVRRLDSGLFTKYNLRLLQDNSDPNNITVDVQIKQESDPDSAYVNAF